MFDTIKPYKELPFWGVVLPEIDISSEEKIKIGAKPDCDKKEFLTQLCRHGFETFVKHRVPKEKHKEYIERIKFELETIEFLGFTNYILMVWDIVAYADKMEIPRGPGRGSVGSSLVCYLIGITRQVDPIELKLFFTRFLSKARAKKIVHNGITYIDGSLAPDIDMDFDYYRRQEIIDYINQKYAGKTAKLLTTTTFTTKILIKDVLKTYEGASEDDANTASSLIEKEFGIPEEIEDALSDDPDKENINFKEWAKDHPETCEIAMGLAGLNRSEGQHASAVLICHDKIDELMPLQLSSGKEIISGFDMYSAQEITLKFDVLGLKNLSVINDCCKIIGKKKEDIDINDNAIYRYLQDFKHRYGIFQLESHAQGNVAVKIRPMNFGQLTACLAISRPGASAYLNQYLKYIHEGEYKTIHPLIDSVLKPTGGVCLYQENLLQMSVNLGLTPDEAEGLRKCVTGDTVFVSKTRGYISIDDLLEQGYENDLFLVMDENGSQKWKKINKIWSTGIHQVVHVECRNGMTVKATRWHQFLTDSGWKARNYLTTDDFMVCAESIEYDGKDVLDENWIYVIIGLIAEGYFVDGYGATFTNFDREIMDLFSNAHKNIFGALPVYSENYHVARINIKNKNEIKKYLKQGKSAFKEIPSILMGCGLENTKKILGMYFSCEGCVLDRQVEMCSKSKKLMFQIQLLLLRFGIHGSVFTKNNPEYGEFYYINIGQYKYLKLFLDNFKKYICSSKIILLEKILLEEKLEYNTLDIIPHTIVNRFINQYGNILGNTGGNFYRESVSRTKFNHFCEKSKDKFWTNFKDGKHRYSQIKCLDKDTREIETFDFTVDEDTPYIIANGMVIHNCIGKKLKHEIPQYREKIYNACEKNGHPKEVADLVWKIAEDSAGYQFSLVHAASYAIITCQTIWLKVNYPLEYYWALLRMSKNDSESQSVICSIEKEMRAQGYFLLPPNLVESNLDFKIEKNGIRYALGSLKGISDKNLEKLESFRHIQNRDKFSLFQSLKNCEINIGIGSALIQAGCLEGFGERAKLVLELALWSVLTDREKTLCLNIGKDVNYDVFKAIVYLTTKKDEKDKLYIKESRFETIKKKIAKHKIIYELNSKNKALCNYFYEKTVLGYSYSQSITPIYGEKVDDLITVARVGELPIDSYCVFIGFAKDCKKGKTKAGNDSFSMDISDDTGTVRVKFFNQKISYCEEANGRLVEDSDLVIVQGKKMDNDMIFADRIGIQTTRIFIKLSELKEPKS